MKKLIYTKTEEIYAKGWKEIKDFLYRQENVTVFKNGRISVLLSNGDQRTFTASQIEDIYEFWGGIWTSPQGIRAIWEIQD